MAASDTTQSDDEATLAKLGYTQSLDRAWSSFSNFAISFTIISVLAGCFTTYAFAWNGGGPIAISWGWPIVCGLILLVAVSMSELVSKYPTAGGIYYWASDLGGKTWGWFTGWFNWVGLVGVVASVDYACATFLGALLGLYGVDVLGMNFGDDVHILSETFFLFVLILLLGITLNVVRTHSLSLVNNVSVFWHVAGVAAIILILIIVPDTHASADFVFTERINNSAFGGGSTTGFLYWFYVLPLGFLLTQYTITGFDASAHISEETHGASRSAARGVWQSIFYSAVIGWFVLLAITFAVQDPDAISKAGGGSLAIFDQSLSLGWQKAVVLISTVGQLFCGIACLTSASRMCFAFSRDRGMPGSKSISKVNSKGVPVRAVLTMAIAALIVTLPALKGDGDFPFAFFAVVSITVIGLYIAYVIPIYLRWRQGSSFIQAKAWNLGNKWRWMNPFAVVWTIIITIIFSLPFSTTGIPWNTTGADGDGQFTWVDVNYAPLTVLAVLIIVGVWWKASAHKYFTGQVRNVDIDTALEGTDPPAGSDPPEGGGAGSSAGA